MHEFTNTVSSSAILFFMLRLKKLSLKRPFFDINQDDGGIAADLKERHDTKFQSE
jgi:hypothetical protein